MKILVFAANLHKGGAIQAALSFTKEAYVKGGEHQWMFVLSPEISSQLGEIEVPNIKKVVLKRPKNIVAQIALHTAHMFDIEREFSPDVSFSIFGPPYWFPRSSHVCGFALGWMIFDDSPVWDRLKLRQYLSRKIKNRALANFFSRKWNYIVETEEARQRLISKLRINPAKVRVIHNGASSYFYNFCDDEKRLSYSNDGFRFLVLSADYMHKNLDFVPEVIHSLAEKTNERFEFLLTLNSSSWERIRLKSQHLSVSNYIKNMGPLTVEAAAFQMNRCNAVFMPSLLETFSATYPETMVIGKPILASDLPFARDICKDAAVYFDPLCSESAANACCRVMTDNILYELCVTKGMDIAKQYPNPSQKFHKTLEALCSFPSLGFSQS